MQPLPRHEAFEVMRFIRDTPPTEAELLEYIGGDRWEAKKRFGDFRAEGTIVYQEGRWILAPGHLSEDGSTFTWENVVLLLDEERLIIKPKVTWLPEEWEMTIGMAVSFYYFFFCACAFEATNPTVGIWIRGVVGVLSYALIALDVYMDIFSEEWTRLQKWQLFVKRTIMGLLLIAPLFFMGRIYWK